MAQKPAGSIPGSRETSSLARYAYMWDKGKDTVKILPVPAPSFSKKAFNIIEQDDGMLIEFDKFSLFIRPR